MKRTISLIILCSMLASLAACGSTSDGKTPTDGTSGSDNTTTTAPETTDPALVPPEATDKYKGKTYRIFNGYSDQTKYVTNDIYPEEQDGEVLNDALHKRCVDTEDKLGITIEVTDGTLSNIKNSIAAADDFADVTYADLSSIMGLVTEGYCRDFYDIPNINLSKAWWDHNAEEKLSFDGQLYYTFNDHIFTQTENCRAVFFNKAIAEEIGVDPEGLYQTVRDGKWTMDLMFNYGKMAVKDLNGDTKINKEDRVGVLNWGFVGLGEALLTGCDAEIIKKDAGGEPYFYCFTEQFATIYSKVLDFLLNDNVVYLGAGANEFMSDHALFMVNSLVDASNLREMKGDFGIIPTPKYNEEQESYQNVSPNPHAMLVPTTVQDIDFAGAAMEELAYQSHITLLPAYYENVLKGKATRDDESIEMLDLIHNSVSYVIKIIGTKFSDAIYAEMQKKNYNLSSMLEKWRSQVETQLSDVLAQFADK